MLACSFPGDLLGPVFPAPRVQEHVFKHGFWCGFSGSNSSPHAFLTIISTLTPDLSPWLRKTIFLNELHFIKSKKLKATVIPQYVCLTTCLTAHQPLPDPLEGLSHHEDGSERKWSKMCSWHELLILSLPRQWRVSWPDTGLAAFTPEGVPPLSFSFRLLVSS